MGELLKMSPAVFAVGNAYQIIVMVKGSALVWVEIDGEAYYDDSNGILRSQKNIHKITVPYKKLDDVGKYTICYRKMIERKAYFSQTEDVVKLDYSFKPVKKDKALAYHIADAHNNVELPVKAVKTFEENCGKIDFLIMNGDVPEDSGDINNFDTIYEIADKVTHGNIPIVFSRGNHDLRGIYAENLTDYTPCENGNSYYTFTLGDIWGIVLDCGEDKDDCHQEYANTVCCHAFRKRETEFIKDIAENHKDEYENENIKHRIVVVHNPFTYQQGDPFNIEEELFGEWLKLLKIISPDVMICGHTHSLFVDRPGCERDSLGQVCTVVEGSKPDYKNNTYSAVGYIFDNNGIEAVFTDSNGNIVMREKI